MNSWICVVLGSRPCTTIEQQRSRSVIMPTSARELVISYHWYGTNVEVAHHLGCILRAVIWRTARWVRAHHFFDLHTRLLPWLLCLFFNLDLVHNLSVARVGLHYANGEVVLCFSINAPRQYDRVFVNLGVDI